MPALLVIAVGLPASDDEAGAASSQAREAAPSRIEPDERSKVDWPGAALLACSQPPDPQTLRTAPSAHRVESRLERASEIQESRALYCPL